MGDVIHTLPAAQLCASFSARHDRMADRRTLGRTPVRAGNATPGPRSAQRPLVDWVHTVNLTAWRKSLFSIPTLQQIAKTWNDVRAARYDVAVDLQGAMRSAVLARWSGAPWCMARPSPANLLPALWYTRRAIASGTHVIEQNLSVAAAVTGRRWACRR